MVMCKNVFSELVKKHFIFLENDYDFLITSDRYSPDVMGNAELIFKSPKTGFQIVLDRNQVLAKIGQVDQPEKKWFEFSDVVRHLSPDIKAAYIFPKDFSDHDKALETQIKRIASLLRDFCKPLLLGDFSMGDRIK
jgi:hypothetical protein